MSTQDTSKIKEGIVNFLRIKGPSLPVHIAQEVKLSVLFTSAFLSELFSEKRIKMSHLRVGSSPIYFLPGQEEGLEKFSSHLKSKEKEAFSLIRERRNLRDYEQEPAIRIALRAIKDFAIPFEKNGELYWRYFIIQEPQKETIEEEKEERIEEVAEKEEVSKEKEKPKKIQKKKIAKKIQKPKKGNEKFLIKVKEFLAKENIEIKGIESFNKEGIVLKVKINEEEKVFIAYNKKRINEKDLINANKKAEELGLKYLILSLEEPPKKIKEMIEAIRNLSGMEKIE